MGEQIEAKQPRRTGLNDREDEKPPVTVSIRERLRERLRAMLMREYGILKPSHFQHMGKYSHFFICREADRVFLRQSGRTMFDDLVANKVVRRALPIVSRIIIDECRPSCRVIWELSYRKIAELSGCRQETAKATLMELFDQGFIIVERREGRRTPLIYPGPKLIPLIFGWWRWNRIPVNPADWLRRESDRAAWRKTKSDAMVTRSARPAEIQSKSEAIRNALRKRRSRARVETEYQSDFDKWEKMSDRGEGPLAS